MYTMCEGKWDAIPLFELFDKVWGPFDLSVKRVELVDEEEVCVLVNLNLLVRLTRV